MVRQLLIACLVAGAVSAQTIRTVNVVCCQFIDTVSGNNTTTIQVGTVVRWQFQGAFPTHTVTNGTGSTAPNAGTLFDASLTAATPQFQFTFNTPGVFPYFCRPHEFLGMNGTVTVTTPATVVSTGNPCAIPGLPASPLLATNGLPQIGNAGFALTITNGLPNSSASIFLAIGIAPQPFPVGSGCLVYLDLASLQAFLVAGVSPIGPVPLNASGAGSVPIPIPMDNGLMGIRVDLQLAIIAPSIPGGVLTSNALTLTVGT